MFAILVESEARKLFLGDGLHLTQAQREIHASYPICRQPFSNNSEYCDSCNLKVMEANRDDIEERKSS